MHNEAAKPDAATDPYAATAASSSAPSLIGKDPIYERWRWQIFFITWLAYAGFYFTRSSFAIAKVPLSDPQIMGWTKPQLAWIDFAYLTAYAVGQFIWGASGDKYGPRRVILGGMLASVVIAVLCGLSSTVVVLGVLMCLQGLCQSTGWAPLAKNIGEFFSQRERGRVVGVWCTNYAAGGFVGSVLLAGVGAAHFGWRYAFFIPAAALFVVWILFLLLQRDKPEDVGLPPIEKYHGEPTALIDPADKPADEKEGTWEVIAEVCRSPMVWLLAAVYFFIKQPRYFLINWGALYVAYRLKLNPQETDAAALIKGMFDLAGPFGVILGGFVSDLVFRAKRMPMSVVGLLVTAVLLFVVISLPANRLMLMSVFFLIGFFLYIPDSLVSATAAVDFGTKKGASTAAGIINGCGSIGAILGGTLPGWISGMVADESAVWNYGFVGLGVCLIVAALLLLPQWNVLPPTANNAGKVKTT